MSSGYVYKAKIQNGYVLVDENFVNMKIKKLHFWSFQYLKRVGDD
jgi:hypothetical protein